MTQFPKSVKAPQSVSEARAERNNHLIKSLGLGIALRSLIIMGELWAVYIYGSAALFMDALSSILDVVCSLLLLLFIKLADRPPDENHPFGHGRFEPLAGLQLGFLLSIIGVGMFIQQVISVEKHVSTEAVDGRLWIIPLIALIFLEICHAYASRAAKKHNSPAIAADAAHYRTDSLTSLLAMISLGAGAFFVDVSGLIDHYGAIAIALVMVILGMISVRDNLNQLLDKVPSAHYFSAVRKAAKNVEGVLDTEKIRIQQYGPDAHVDIDIEVDPQLSVEKAHTISQHVRVAIQKEWPMVRDVMVHIEPYYPGDH